MQLLPLREEFSGGASSTCCVQRLWQPRPASYMGYFAKGVRRASIYWYLKVCSLIPLRSYLSFTDAALESAVVAFSTRGTLHCFRSSHVASMRTFVYVNSVHVPVDMAHCCAACCRRSVAYSQDCTTAKNVSIRTEPDAQQLQSEQPNIYLYQCVVKQYRVKSRAC